MNECNITTICFGGMVHTWPKVSWAVPYHIISRANDLFKKICGLSELRSGSRTRITINNVGAGLHSLTD